MTYVKGISHYNPALPFLTTPKLSTLELRALHKIPNHLTKEKPGGKVQKQTKPIPITSEIGSDDCANKTCMKKPIADTMKGLQARSYQFSKTSQF